MSVRQKVILWIGIAVFVGMGTYAPYKCYQPHIRAGALYSGSGYGLIFKNETRAGWYERRVDFGRLTVQWVCVAAATGGIIVTLGKRSGKKKESGVSVKPPK